MRKVRKVSICSRFSAFFNRKVEFSEFVWSYSSFSEQMHRISAFFIILVAFERYKIPLANYVFLYENGSSERIFYKKSLWNRLTFDFSRLFSDKFSTLNDFQSFEIRFQSVFASKFAKMWQILKGFYVFHIFPRGRHNTVKIAKNCARQRHHQFFSIFQYFSNYMKIRTCIKLLFIVFFS